MSKSNQGNNQQANSPQASSQALLDELRVAADRARDERLKLARLVKHSADLPIGSAESTSPAAPSDARLNALTQQVQQLEQAVSEKLNSMGQAQQDIDNRAQYLESLKETIEDTTRAFVSQVEQAQQFKAHVDAAKQHVRMSAGRVVEDIRDDIKELESPIAQRMEELTNLDQQIDQRIARMQQMHKQANEAVDKHLLGALRNAKEQAAELVAPVKAEMDKHLGAQQAEIEKAVQAKIADLDMDVEEALSPLTNRFNEIIADAQSKAELLADTLPDRIQTIGSEQLDELRETFRDQATQITSGLDKQLLDQAQQAMHERIAASLDEYLAQADEQAGGYVDGLIKRLAEAKEEAGKYVEQFNSEMEQVKGDAGETVGEILTEISQAKEDSAGYVNKLVNDLDQAREDAITRFEQAAGSIEVSASIDREQLLLRLRGEVERLEQLAKERADHATKLIEQASDGIHGRAAAAVDAALRQADKKLEEYESSAVDHLRAIDEGIEHGIDESFKRIIENERSLKKQGEDAARAAEAGIADAQQRIAQFEAGITQRIGLATQSVDDAIGAVDGRLEKVEQDASARVMQIVDLAETSGKAVAESISQLAQSADETAAKAQQDLEEKLKAFEQISADALKGAETALRSNIGELRDASRAMIEVVTRQVKAQANEIEPQTREVITHAESTMRRRLGELRDAAQSMVDLAVARLENQLEEVKTKAQHAAFTGVQPTIEPNEPEQGNEAA